jgi:hypothetical protein
MLTLDSDVASLISTYGSAPAVFTSSHVPEDVSGTYIWTPPNLSDIAYDTKTTTGRDIHRQVGCYATDTGSDLAIENLAEAVRTVFHRQTVNVGQVNYHCTASGPTEAPTGEGIVGRIVTIRLIYQE